MGKQGKQCQTLFFWALKSLQMVTTAMKLKDACSWKKSYDQSRQHIKKQKYYFPNKGPSSQSSVFSSSHVWMWELDYKESWMLKNWCFWTVVLKSLESPLDSKEIQPVHSKGNQSWIFIGRTDVEAETPILWPHDVKSWLIWKDADGGKDRGQKEKGTMEEEIIEWHHLLNGHEFGWTLGVCDGQGGLACCSSWGHKELDTTERLNWTTSCDYCSDWEMTGVVKKLVLVDHEEDFSLISNSSSEMVQGSLKVPMTPSGVIWSQNYFHSCVKVLFACFMVLTFGLVVRNQWCVELQGPL